MLQRMETLNKTISHLENLISIRVLSTDFQDKPSFLKVTGTFWYPIISSKYIRFLTLTILSEPALISSTISTEIFRWYVSMCPPPLLIIVVWPASIPDFLKKPLHSINHNFSRFLNLQFFCLNIWWWQLLFKRRDFFLCCCSCWIFPEDKYTIVTKMNLY